MSRPRFQSRAIRDSALLGYEPVGDPWRGTCGFQRERAEQLISAHGWIPRADFVDNIAARLAISHHGLFCHDKYLSRTGGNRAEWVEDVPLMWDCCGREQLLGEVHYDRHGELRPEDVAIVRALAYYHRCDA